ncbi:hypothetical protein FB451DRAFT_1177077 [Mycena latifolia]|nr:hypothetical protein FB451DRAFT_1177077 [Mycena latifolia]
MFIRLVSSTLLLLSLTQGALSVGPIEVPCESRVSPLHVSAGCQDLPASVGNEPNAHFARSAAPATGAICYRKEFRCCAEKCRMLILCTRLANPTQQERSQKGHKK